MQIPLTLINSYTDKLNNLSNATKRVVRQSLSNIDFDTIAELREILIERLDPILGASTDMAAAYAAEFYDMVRELETGERSGAIAESGRNPEATEGYIRAAVSGAITKGLSGMIPGIEDRADYEIKRAAGECIYYNGERDKKDVRFARVPSGAETCEFCIMLASRGAVYRSERSAGSDGHYHAHCDCRIVPFFEGTEVEGYDPDALYEQWRESGFQPKPKKRKVEHEQ